MVIDDPKVAAMDICFFRTFVLFLVACCLVRFYEKDLAEIKKYDTAT